jgi:chemotaxis protein methyltransferase CheR
MQVSDASLRILAGFLEARTGQQLTMNRRWRVETALRPVMRAHDVASLDQLVGALVARREEKLADEVIEALLNNETFFYRDRQAFELLLGPALRRLEQARARKRRLSIWSAGCSTGQEAWSLAMHFAEQKHRWKDWTVDIVATDISQSAIRQAREGLYSSFEVQRGLSVLQMMRWFEERPGSGWAASRELKPRVRFEVRNLLAEPPPGGPFDIILCRNVLLYFGPHQRRAAFERLSCAIAPDGALMLGAGETVIGQTDAFASDRDCRGLYLPVEEQGRGRRAAS